MSAMRARMRKEVEMLESDPPFGVSAWPKDDQLDRLEAQIVGPEGSPYEKGTFNLDIEIPERYPFEPPKVRFVTPIYHPNIDDAGRICLDTLKMQPKGSWLPSVNISTLLTTIRLLMAEPNADDGLMPDITDQFKHNRELFNRKAIESTHLHAYVSVARVVASMAPSASSEHKGDDSIGTGQATDAGAQLNEVNIHPKSKRGRENDESDSFSDDDDSFSDDSDFSDDDDGNNANVKAKRKRQKTE